jgi:hypothetical protein
MDLPEMSRRLAHVAVRFFVLSISISSFGLAGCGSATEDNTEESSANVSTTVYANVYDVLGGADLNNYLSLRTRLDNDFLNICGDTFCDGDYGQFQPVQLDCSMSKNTKKMAQCEWTFAASIEYVNGSSAKVTSDVGVVTCTIPVKGLATDFIVAMNVAAPGIAMQQVVPGGTQTMYDYVSACFENVKPKAPPTPTKTQTYSSAEQTAIDNDPDSFIPGVQNLQTAFANACADTYCDGDYNDITALGFTCAVSKAGNVKGCGWSFAGQYTTVGAYGVITPHRKTWVCPLPFSGKQAALTSYIQGSDPYDATLPGSTETTASALAGCFN